MGASQSRIEEKPEPVPVNEQDSVPMVTIKVSDDLLSEMNGEKTFPMATESSDEQKVYTQKDVENAYILGAKDYEKNMAQRAKSAPVQPSAQPQVPKFLDETEEVEKEKVRKLIEDINSRNFRAPIRTVECSKERDACLKCYQENKSDILVCKEVSDMFNLCAQKKREEFVKGKQ